MAHAAWRSRRMRHTRRHRPTKVLEGMSNVFELVVWMTAASAGGLLVAVVGYAIGSFALMRRHAARRSIGTWLRELGREVTLADLSVAAPLFYAQQADFPMGLYKNTQAWFGRVSALPCWAQTAPQFAAAA